jgi:hypothetical protein
MGYRDNIKVLLMRGKAYKSKGQGIVGLGRKMHLPAIEAPRGTGTITNRGIVDRAHSEDYARAQMGKLNIGGKVKKSSNKQFKSLKFNF